MGYIEAANEPDTDIFNVSLNMNDFRKLFCDGAVTIKTYRMARNELQIKIILE